MAATLCQSYVSSCAPTAGATEPGNNFQFIYPNAVGAGNCLVLKLTYPNGATLSSLSDTNNTWSTTPAISAANPGGNNTDWYVLPNAVAGKATMTITFSASQQPVAWTWMEWAGIATSSPANGTAQRAGIIGSSTLNTGAFTPGNNNANGGNLILAAFDFADGGTAGSNVTTWTPSGSFTLHDGDISGINNQGFPKASMYFVQATSASITPQINAAGDNTDHFNCVALALALSPGAGTIPPAGIRINKITQLMLYVLNSATWVLQFPTTGNLRVCQSENASGTISSLTDSEGNTWSQAVAFGGTQGGIYYWGNTAANSALTVTVHISAPSSGPSLVWFYDISGALATNHTAALGATASTPSTVPGSVNVTNAPSIATTGTNSLVIAGFSNGLGPTALAAPSGSGIYNDTVTYTGATDAGPYVQGNGFVHVFTTTPTTINFGWTMLNGVQIETTVAAEFLPAPLPPALNYDLMGQTCQ